MKKVIVIGGTGQTGYFIVKKLLEQNYQIRLASRNIQKVERLFKDEAQKINKIVEVDLLKEAQKFQENEQNNYKNSYLREYKLEQLFYQFEDSYVICAHGKMFGNNQTSEHIEFGTVKLMVQLASRYKCKKFVLVSALSIERPYHFVSWFLNNILDNVLGWKLAAENYLRQSDLSYIIIRPGQLEGDINKSPVQNFTIGQGDKLMGKIQRATVAEIIYNLLKPDISSYYPKQVTFECISTSVQKQQRCLLSQEKIKNLENDNMFCMKDPKSHRKAKLIINSLIMGSISIICLFRYYCPLLLNDIFNK